MRVLSSKTLHIAAYPNGPCAGLAESITSKALISSRGVLNSAPMSNPMVREIAFCKASRGAANFGLFSGSWFSACGLTLTTVGYWWPA